MKITVTGGAGFVGTNLLKKLLQNDHEVTVIDNFSTVRDLYWQANNDFELFDASILDVATLNKACRGADAVIHLAARGNVIDSLKDPLSNFETNVLGTLNVLTACLDNSVSKILFSSTGGALMGHAVPPVVEDTIPTPISPYGASKASAEHYIRCFRESYGLSHTIFRFGNVLGKYSSHKVGVINKFIVNCKKGDPIEIFGDVSRDFINVEDLVDAIVNSLHIDEALNQTFHLGSGIETPISIVAELVCEKMRKNSNNIKIKKRRQGEIGKTFLNVAKAQKVLGLKNTVSTEQLVNQTVEWLIENEK